MIMEKIRLALSPLFKSYKTELRFTEKKEKDFAWAYQQNNKKGMVVSSIIFTSIFLISYLLDLYFSYNYIIPLYTRIIIFLIFLITILAIAKVKSSFLLQIIMVIYPLIVSVAILILAYQAPFPTKDMYYYVLVLILLYISIFARIYFTSYIIAALFVLISLNITLYLDPHAYLHDLIIKNYILIGGFIFAMFASYMTEKTMRQFYSYSKIIENKNRILSISENYANNIVNSMTNMLIVTGKNGLIKKVNPATINQLGYDENEIIGNKLEKFFDKNNRLTFNDILEKKNISNMEILLFKKEKIKIFALFSSSLIYDNSGKIEGVVCVAQDITDRKAIEKEIWNLAYYDSLTALPNRLSFEEKMKSLFATAQRHHHIFGLLFIDIDNFKSINDTLGHSAGDILLKQFGKNLRQLLREEDFIARIGGDEFAIILPEIQEANDAGVVADRLVKSSHITYNLLNNNYLVSTSVGIAIYPNDGTTYDELTKHADIALYDAKNLGRNTYQFFTKELNQTHIRRMHIQNALHFALEKNEFFLVYQPEYDLRNDSLFGFEALIRWKNPELGFINPDEFIPMTDNNRSIIPIGQWVMKTAIQKLHEWKSKNKDINIRLSINFSTTQLLLSDCYKDICDLLQEYHVSPKSIVIELTESTIMTNYEKAAKVLNKFHDLGCSIAIDDFGTGYSSLSQLKHLPIDILKIDKSFIQAINKSKEDTLIVSAIINLSKALNLNLVAEGVETAEQLDFVKKKGCHIVQGYYFSKPMEGDKATKLIFSNKND